MLSNLSDLITPVTVGTLIVLAILLFLILVPGLAFSAASRVGRWRDGLFRAASGVVKGIKDHWTLKGDVEKQKRRMPEKVAKDIAKREKLYGHHLTDPERAEIISDYKPKDPSVGDIASAWARRIIYVLLVIVCAGSDYVLVSTRAPLLFGGGNPPPFLKWLFQYLQVITGVLFVSIAALSGMLIEDYSRDGLSDAVRIEPDISPPWKLTKLILAVAMFVIDVIVVIFLTAAGIIQQYSLVPNLDIIFVVFVGTSALVAMGIFLAGPGLIQGAEGLGWLVIGGLAAIFCILVGTIFAFIAAILLGLDVINRLLVGLFSGEKPVQRPLVSKKDLSIIGYGPEGSDFVVDVCEQLSGFFGTFAWMAGVYSPNDDAKLKARLARARTALISVSVGPNEQSAAELLKENLLSQFRGKAEIVKPLLWVVSGDDDLADCLPVLKSLEKEDKVKNIKLVILWFVPNAISQATKNLAATLHDWALVPESILMTTLLVESESPLSKSFQQGPLLVRSVAALIGASAIDVQASFATVATQLHNGGFPFAALASGSIGVNTAKAAFNVGPLAGPGKDINPISASVRLQHVGEAAFKNLGLSTVSYPWMTVKPTTTNPNDSELQLWEKEREGLFVNLVVPLRLRMVREFKEAVCFWLYKDYGVNQNHVTVEQSPNEKDTGVNIQGQYQQWRGEYYFHFTAIRGVGTGKGEAPQDLTGGTPIDISRALGDSLPGSAAANAGRLTGGAPSDAGLNGGSSATTDVISAH